MPQPLNSKDHTAFRQLVKLYETKQYKKALKTADQLLKKNPNHGETEAMKALTMNAQGHMDEAFTLGKVALQHDMKSHICWHVYGLLYRSAKNLEEAIKAYKFALKLEPESPQILRDLAYLQVQMRDYQGYIQSRKTMLQVKPAIRQNWTALAVAYHLAGELSTAEDLLQRYESTLKNPRPRTDLEHSEAALYRNSIIEEMGDAERGLEHLDTIYRSNLDRTAVMEARARFLLKLGKTDEAEKAYRALIERNNEYRPYYESLESILGLDRSNPDHTQKLVELYESFAAENERLDAARRIPLDFLGGEEFKRAADQYLRRMLKKGVPSTFANIKALYTDDTKRSTIPDLVHGYITETAAGGSGGGDNVASESDKQTNGDNQPPDRFHESCVFFLAQHYNYYATRDLDKSMKYIDQAIDLTPKSVDYHQIKARIWKHLGDSQKAADIMEQARQLDEKDRYINTKCAKYQLRNNDNEQAIKTMSKFTRNEAVGGALGDLHDMQCMWYITEDGEAYARRAKYGLALKRFKAIYDIFHVWQEDQFDFHQFSLRKGQIRAYIDMIRWEDHLREHPFFTRAAIKAAKIYVKLHDDPNLAHSSGLNGALNLDGMDANEKKKAIKKAKKEQERQEKLEAEKREAEKKIQKKNSSADADAKKEDADPQGHKLVETKTPLEDAMPYVSFLVEFSPKNIDAQLASFEVFLRRSKNLMALKCLQAAYNIDSEDPKLHEGLIRLRLSLDKYEPTSPKVASVLKSCSKIVPSSSSLKQYNASYLEKNGSSAQHVLSALIVRNLIEPASKSQNTSELSETLELASAHMEFASEALKVLEEDWKVPQEALDAFRQKAAKKWPDASVFKKV